MFLSKFLLASFEQSLLAMRRLVERTRTEKECTFWWVTCCRGDCGVSYQCERPSGDVLRWNGWHILVCAQIRCHGLVSWISWSGSCALGMIFQQCDMPCTQEDWNDWMNESRKVTIRPARTNDLYWGLWGAKRGRWKAARKAIFMSMSSKTSIEWNWNDLCHRDTVEHCYVEFPIKMKMKCILFAPCYGKNCSFHFSSSLNCFITAHLLKLWKLMQVSTSLCPQGDVQYWHLRPTLVSLVNLLTFFLSCGSLGIRKQLFRQISSSIPLIIGIVSRKRRPNISIDVDIIFAQFESGGPLKCSEKYLPLCTLVFPSNSKQYRIPIPTGQLYIVLIGTIYIAISLVHCSLPPNRKQRCLRANISQDYWIWMMLARLGIMRLMLCSQMNQNDPICSMYVSTEQ